VFSVALVPRKIGTPTLLRVSATKDTKNTATKDTEIAATEATKITKKNL